MNRLLKPGLAVLILLTSGCMGKALTHDTTTEMMTVAVNPDVTYGPYASRDTTGKMLAGGLGGIVGALISNAVTKDEDEAFTQLLKSSTQLDQVAYNCVTDALKNDAHWSKRLVNNTDQAGAVFEIMVFPYGLSTVGTKSDYAKPTFGLHIKLIDKKGAVLWNVVRSITKYPSGLPLFTTEQYTEDLSRFDAAATVLCKELTPQFLKSRESS